MLSVSIIEAIECCDRDCHYSNLHCISRLIASHSGTVTYLAAALDSARYSFDMASQDFTLVLDLNTPHEEKIKQSSQSADYLTRLGARDSYKVIQGH